MLDTFFFSVIYALTCIITHYFFFSSWGCIIHRAKENLKPSNVVLDDDGNAVLIDISGIGGVTHGWCAPEIRNEISPFELQFQTRQLNDIWAYRKLLREIVSNAGNSPFVGILKWVASYFTEGCSQQVESI